MEKSLMSILIVEDMEPIAASFGAVLRGEGYERLFFAGSAEEAFEFLGVDKADASKKDIDLVLMDIMLPEIDGIKACRKIKADGHYKDMPIIMVTAKEEPETLYEAFSAGAVDYILKPVKKLELIARVGSVLKLKHEMDRRKLWEKKLLETTVQLNEAKRTIGRLSGKNISSCINDSRSFTEMFRNEWESAIQKESPVSLLMINVDCFDEFTKEYGDQCAEDCLGEVGNALCQAMKRKRPGDFITRYGCDDFAVVLPTTNVSGALIVAERIKAQVAALGIENKAAKEGDCLSVSIGVASAMPTRSSTTKILIAGADEALYLAKKEGGNRIKVASS